MLRHLQQGHVAAEIQHVPFEHAGLALVRIGKGNGHLPEFTALLAVHPGEGENDLQTLLTGMPSSHGTKISFFSSPPLFFPGERFYAQCFDQLVDVGGLEIHPTLRHRQQHDTLSLKRLGDF